MRTAIRKIILTTLLIASPVFINTLLADGPTAPPTNPGTGDQPIGGAPIDGGLSILLALGAGYGAKKFYLTRKRKT
ncbi:MAG: hypothetical protein FJY10_08255 [Bacteroidetes bacterium]|nr:hypothetical protein [Bacteroidota bacterium]